MERTMKKIILAVLLSSFAFTLTAQSEDKFSGWKKAETEHFTFIFEESSRQTTEEYALIADNAWNKIAEIYSVPKNHFNIYVTDRTNTVNAFTYFAPTEIGMFTTPPSINDFGFRAPWKELFFTHELIHAANATFEEKSTVVEKAVGPFIKNLDFSGVPGWALEGLTTVLETELSAGGRGRSPYFELEYKAPTLENSLISYNQIGMEQEPPRGQAYIMGYLIMRSIADRYGIQALADIERNRSLLGSWEASVKLVTGHTPEEIYRDVKIALVKKYADEREIPEGITISPRSVNTNYSEPAFVYEDGSFIALRSRENAGAAVVKFNPALKNGSNYVELIAPEKDLNTIFEETILFEGAFPEIHSVTADENETVYASMVKNIYHKQPGLTVENSIYKWNKENGLSKLTKDGSYIQPSVSRDGKTLVACRQYGLTFSLVQLDTETGAEKILLQDSKQDFIQPSVNDDGSKIAFMAVDGTRAKICVMNLDNPENYEIVYNNGETITDPSYPHWVENKLVITDNQRGRLEAFEINEDGIFEPVVADPCGVLWATKTEKGVIYSTFSATGYVVKIKPESEWGEVPDFNGPSMPGDIITFGYLESDYLYFNPYEKLCEVEVPEKSAEELKKEAKSRNKDEPVPIKGKVVKHRTEKSLEALNELPAPKTTLENEKKYIPLPQPLLYLPIAFPNATDSEKSYWGFGASLICLTPKLQMTFGGFFADFIYFPEFNNFTFGIDYYASVGSGTFQFFANRQLESVLNSNEDEIIGIQESNILNIGYKHPLWDVADGRNNTSLYAFADTVLDASISDAHVFKAFSRSDYSYGINGIVGLEFTNSKRITSYLNTICANLYGYGCYDSNFNKIFPGSEIELVGKRRDTKSDATYDVNFKARYADYPVENAIRGSLVKFNGKVLDGAYPGRSVLQVGSSLNNFLGTGLDLRMYEETYFSFGKNSVNYETPDSGLPLNFAFSNKFATGFEIGLDLDSFVLVGGVSTLTDFSEKALEDFNFYFTFKMDWFRF